MCVPVCPQSWTLPHQSSPLLCLLTLSLPPPPPPAPPPPCVEMVHIMCLQTHAYRQWPPHTDTQHNIRNPHICMPLHTFTQHTITHAHSNNLMQCTETACHNTRSCHFGNMVITEFKLRSQPSANKMVGYSDTTIRDGCIECTMHDVLFGSLATYCIHPRHHRTSVSPPCLPALRPPLQTSASPFYADTGRDLQADLRFHVSPSHPTWVQSTEVAWKFQRITYMYIRHPFITFSCVFNVSSSWLCVTGQHR